MVNACWNTLEKMASEDGRIVVMASDSMNQRQRFNRHTRSQYYEMGIAECNLIAAAAGMASCGLLPYVYAVAPFLVYRANEFIRDDICLQKRNVKIIAYSAGMDYCTSGPTHHTTEDIAILRAFPNITIFSPASPIEVEYMVRAAKTIEGPVYIRLNREHGREIHNERYLYSNGKAEIIKKGSDITVVSTGSITYDVIQAVRLVEKKGIDAELISLGMIKPFDKETIRNSIAKTHSVVTVEEHTILGGIGGMIAELIAETGLGVTLTRMGLKDSFAVGYGNHDEIKEMNGLSVNCIVDTICNSVGRYGDA